MDLQSQVLIHELSQNDLYTPSFMFEETRSQSIIIENSPEMTAREVLQKSLKA